ncbi:PGPGW domain-containing protein [Microcella sp.]|uniref:PGPGW domain-containing protein n=1 Tax=Microcella sp. TaxID=1913979 RepID=UPI00391C230B
MSTESPGQQRVLQPGDPGYERADEARRTSPVRGRAAAAREAIRRRPGLDRVYRTGVKVVGGTTVGLGIVLMPLPGPGTLVALGGLAILGTESERAKKLNDHAVRAAKAAAAAAARRRDARRASRTQRPYRATAD